MALTADMDVPLSPQVRPGAGVCVCVGGEGGREGALLFELHKLFPGQVILPSRKSPQMSV